MDTKTSSLLGFIIGVAVATYWSKIRKFLEPYLKDATKFLAEQQEFVGDLFPPSEIKVKKPAKKALKEKVEK